MEFSAAPEWRARDTLGGMPKRILGLALLAALLVSVPADALGAKAKRKPAYPHAARLASFKSCTSFLSYVRLRRPHAGCQQPHRAPRHPARHPGLRRELARQRQGRLPAGRARTGGRRADGDRRAAAGEDFSDTNVQEAGIDEPDIVKTDGTTVFALENSKLYAVGVEGADPKLLGTLDLTGSGHQMLLKGNRLLVASTVYEQFKSEPGPEPGPEPRPSPPSSSSPPSSASPDAPASSP